MNRQNQNATSTTRSREEGTTDTPERAIPRAKDPHREKETKEPSRGRTGDRTKESHPGITTEQAPNKIHNEGRPNASHGNSTRIQTPAGDPPC
jgi:hypothetical protein